MPSSFCLLDWKGHTQCRLGEELARILRLLMLKPPMIYGELAPAGTPADGTDGTAPEQAGAAAAPPAAAATPEDG